MFKLTLIIALIAFGISKYNERNPCTDDGCPEFFDEIETPIPNDDIRGDIHPTIQLHYASHKVAQAELGLPDIDTSSKDQFVYSLNKCINFLYDYVEDQHKIPNELIIAQAAIETGWGKSRFANEGNNLFGIRTFNKDSEWLLPITWNQNKWIGWGVKVYQSKCQSVKDYVRIINTVFAYEKFRELRSQNANVYDLVDTLDKYATKNSYTELVKKVIKYNIEGVYEL